MENLDECSALVSRAVIGDDGFINIFDNLLCCNVRLQTIEIVSAQIMSARIERVSLRAPQLPEFKIKAVHWHDQRPSEHPTPAFSGMRHAVKNGDHTPSLSYSPVPTCLSMISVMARSSFW